MRVVLVFRDLHVEVEHDGTYPDMLDDMTARAASLFRETLPLVVVEKQPDA